MATTRDEVIRQIFGPDTSWLQPDEELAQLCPTYQNLESFADLLKEDPSEDQLQHFLEEVPQFILGLFPGGVLAFLAKPPIGNLFKADFAVLEYGQGGCFIHLIEIERSGATLFTKRGTPARTLQEAMAQVRDWHQWISANMDTFVRDTVERAKELPQYHAGTGNKSFKLNKSIETLWYAFGGYTYPKVFYRIVAGRWANLSDRDRKRLIFLNTHDGELHNIYTFDQVARRAFDRPLVRLW